MAREGRRCVEVGWESNFCSQKDGCCFALYTDIAAQRLDFVTIHWVVQLK